MSTNFHERMCRRYGRHIDDAVTGNDTSDRDDRKPDDDTPDRTGEEQILGIPCPHLYGSS